MHRRTSRFSADDHEPARGFVRQIAGEYLTLEDQDPDERTAEERARQLRTVHGAVREARRLWNPSPTQLHLDTIAFVGREVWAVAAQLASDLTPTPTPTLGSARVTAACVA
jgi:hypothetical protein